MPILGGGCDLWVINLDGGAQLLVELLKVARRRIRYFFVTLEYRACTAARFAGWWGWAGPVCTVAHGANKDRCASGQLRLPRPNIGNYIRA
jgi:hypothetical protein